MGILPIGFFSPLPLAMMIPFMATQSLAMGEAFGKSFQYGKRKISSMTNEEFNKLTFHDLMVEQTANIKAIIPELKQQMSMSKDMQKAIFQEMIQLIPTFFESFKKSLPSDIIETSSQASPLPEIQNIRYTTDRDFELQQQRIDDALKLFEENFLKQQGTKESLELKLNPPPPDPSTLIAEAEAKAEKLRKSIPSKKTLSAAEDPIYLAWITKLGGLKSQYQIKTKELRDLEAHNKTVSARQSANNQRRVGQLVNQIRGISSQIRLMSQDYRNPNNLIRENALRLRANIKQWT